MERKRIRICEAVRCENTTKNSLLAFFSLPTDSASLQKWTTNIKLKQSSKKFKYICSRHFKLEAFTNTFKNRLLKDAYPCYTIPPRSNSHCEKRVNLHNNDDCTAKLQSIEIGNSSNQDLKLCASRDNSDSLNSAVTQESVYIGIKREIIENVMGDTNEEALRQINESYVPFLKKLVDHLQKKGKLAEGEKWKRYKYLYDKFVDEELDDQEKVTLYNNYKDKLDDLCKEYNKKKKSKSEKASDVKLEGSDDSTSKIEIAQVKSKNGPSTSQQVVVEPQRIMPAASIKKEKPEPKTSSHRNGEKDRGCMFVCASCQFRTSEETEFMKHARTDHRTDLSLWCKQCGKCFSNAGVLVAHIKEQNCEREDMIYRCGVKGCTFETASGQTFVHHLRHCHKGSPFIFCIHCQKIFTLPHCLILHMQNECPFKHKNRQSSAGGEAPPTPAVASAAKMSSPTVAKSTPVQSNQKVTPITTVKAVIPSPTTSTPVRTSPPSVSTSRGRARGRRGRRRTSRPSYSDSDTDSNPDDPVWEPDESATSLPLRRSARWAKRVCDAENPDIFDTDPVKKKRIEQPGKTTIKCPCCNFSALFQSLVNDHFVTHHKDPKKMACLECKVKFENMDSFIEHFSKHENDKSGSSSPAPSSEPAVAEEAAEAGTANKADIPNSCPISLNFKPGEVPVEKSQKEQRVKSFEELKSPSDILKMKEETKLKHFFKCVAYSCQFTTDNKDFYIDHTKSHLNDPSSDGLLKTAHCLYCLQEYSDAKLLVNHMLEDHGRRVYQCSLCFYRAVSKAHVQLHTKSVHGSHKGAPVLNSSLHIPHDFNCKKGDSGQILNTAYPYVCCVGNCEFEVLSTREFEEHNMTAHKSVTVFVCYYCKVDFLSLKRLMSHFRIHGINNFQCHYCVHGTETSEEMLLHITNVHPDRIFKVQIRGNKHELKSKNHFEVVMAKKKDGLASVTRQQLKYPEEINELANDLFCQFPLCTDKHADLDSYLDHVTGVHCAVNIPCPHCSLMSDSLADFKNHLMCHGPELYVCNSKACDFYSWKKTDVDVHIKEKHSQGGVQITLLRSCLNQEKMPDFPKIKSTALELKQDENIFVCPFCYYKTNNKQMMKNHIYMELDYKRFSCSHCFDKCCSRKEVVDHFASAHKVNQISCGITSNPQIEVMVRKYLSPTNQALALTFIQEGESSSVTEASVVPCLTCKNCSVPFLRTSVWHQHLKSCLWRGYCPYRCNLCGGQVMDLTTLKQHTSKMHPGNALQFTYTSVEMTEGRIGGELQKNRLDFLKPLIEHLAKKSGENEKQQERLELKQYKCAYCEEFEDNFKQNVEMHCLEIHATEKSHFVRCGRDLSLSDNFSFESGKPINEASHSAFSVTTETVKRYHCDSCTKKTFSLEELLKHFNTNHNKVGVEFKYFYLPDCSNEFTPEVMELYGCAYCSVSQENLFHLHRHCRNLHSDMPFKVCGRSVTSASVLCPQCPAKLLSQEMMTQHIRLHHSKRKATPIKGQQKMAKIEILTNTSKGKSILDLDGSCVIYCGQCGSKMVREYLESHFFKEHSNYDQPMNAVYLTYDLNDTVLDPVVPSYGTVCNPMAFRNLTVNLQTKDTYDYVKLPIEYIMKMFDMKPKVNIYKLSVD